MFMEKGKNIDLPVILVDDEDQFRRVMARRLKKKGFKPVEASSGRQCLTLLDAYPMSVVILDVKMPGMNGIETLKAVREKFPKTQVILLTGNADIKDGIEGIKAGAFDYLTKPADLSHLLEKIRQSFEMIQLAEEREKEKAYRKRLERKMVDTERLVALGTMSTGIAHEINNPLAIINESAGFMKMVLESPEMKRVPKREALMKGVVKIEDSIKRARKITHGLLGHVKKQTPATAEVDIYQLVDETLGLVDKEIQIKKIKVTWNRQPPGGRIAIDPYQLRQLLINLIDNAVYAVGENGRITFSAWKEGHDFVLTVQDNGVGISRENLGKIFDPFFTTKSFEQGTGLGLFVVHKIVRRLGGDIDVESRIGKGTSFTLRLPKGKKRNLKKKRDEKE